MSEAFEAILVQAPKVRFGMNACHIVAFLLAVTFALKTQSTRRAWIYAVVIAVLGGFAAQVVFERWWGSLNAAIDTRDDFGWVADHDGGGLIIVFLENAVKAFGVFLIAGLIGSVNKNPREVLSAPPEESPG